MSRCLVIIGLIFNLIGTIFLFLGSRHLPWDIQSVGGKTNKEFVFYVDRQREVVIGFALLFVGFFLQLIGVIR